MSQRRLIWRKENTMQEKEKEGKEKERMDVNNNGRKEGRKERIKLLLLIKLNQYCIVSLRAVIAQWYSAGLRPGRSGF
jgi:hypothetical protein